MGLLVCENRNDSVLGISRIYANGNVLYQRDPATLTGANPGIEGSCESVHSGQDLLYAQRLQILLGQEIADHALPVVCNERR